MNLIVLAVDIWIHFFRGLVSFATDFRCVNIIILVVFILSAHDKIFSSFTNAVAHVSSRSIHFLTHFFGFGILVILYCDHINIGLIDIIQPLSSG
ncbi:hypothetical protein SDC9_69927 [bioreactor metagenome]|uniref:Uncharacterized protein n=1 Tax=bioreactor metagenome TaxID=1076179 RepID=A0A644YBE7_9ZZZZ